MSNTKQRIVNRSQRVAFMDTSVSESETEKFERMTKFTSMTNAKNPKEYSRQYVDEDTEQSDVVGYAPSVDYSFDRHTDNPVHEKICKIHDGELLGNDTHVDIVLVDLFKKSTTGEKYYATKRTYAVIPDSDGDGTDALIYSGSFKAVSGIEEGYVTFDGGEFKIATYTKGNYEATTGTA